MNIAELFLDASHVGSPDKARTFSEPFGNNISNWWRECPCGSWMLWVAGNSGVVPSTLVTAACECARQSLRFLPPKESRPEAVIAVAEKWTEGVATVDDCRNAANSIGAIQTEIGERLQSDILPPIAGVNTAAAMLAAAAAEMPANAAAFSADQKWCAKFSSQAATRAAAAARHAIDDEGWWTMQKTCANLVRKTLPEHTA